MQPHRILYSALFFHPKNHHAQPQIHGVSTARWGTPSVPVIAAGVVPPASGRRAHPPSDHCRILKWSYVSTIFGPYELWRYCLT